MDNKKSSANPSEMDGKQLDFFLATSDDPPLRDNRDAMEYPFLALQKRRVKPIKFANAQAHLRISGDIEFGIATIWDWDLIIGLSAQINDAIERGLLTCEGVRFVPHDLLRSVGRGTSGRDYQELAAAIRRLRATTVTTNIRHEDQPETGEEVGFSWIESYRIPKRYSLHPMTPEAPDGKPDPLKPWEVRLCPWLYNAIKRRNGILAVHPDYFQLTGGIERWLYRLARKAVPDHADVSAINWRMETLHERSGVTSPLRNFALQVRHIAERNTLPEYGVTVTKERDHETVTFWRDRSKPVRPRRGFPRLP